MKKQLIFAITTLSLCLCALVGLVACGEKPQELETLPVLISISVDTMPTKTKYVAGEMFDKTGMVIHANYDNGSSKTINNYTISQTTAFEETDNKITITYEDKSTQINIGVLTSIYVITKPTKLDYEQNEYFDKTNMQVRASYSDGTDEIIDNSLIVVENAGLLDTKSVYYFVELSYKNKSDSVAVTVSSAGLEIDGKKLKGLGDCADADVWVPRYVNYVEESAFKDVKSVNEIYFMGLVTYIGDSAFEGCSSLREFDQGQYASGLASTYIGKSAFKNCTALTKTNINFSTISDYAFQNCINFEEPWSFSSTGGSWNTEILDFLSIGDYAFDGCTKLEYIKLDTVQSIGEGCFRNCSSLDFSANGKRVFEGLNLETIGAKAFEGCNIKILVLGKSQLLTTASSDDACGGLIGMIDRLCVAPEISESSFNDYIKNNFTKSESYDWSVNGVGYPGYARNT